MGYTVLIVDDERAVLSAFERLFDDVKGVSIVTAQDHDEALKRLGSGAIDLIIADDVMPGTDSGEMLGRIDRLYPDIHLMMLSEGEGDQLNAVLAKLGRDLEVIPKPWDAEDVKKKVDEALAIRALTPEQLALMRSGGLTLRQVERAEKVRSRLQREASLGQVLVELGDITEEQYAGINQRRLAQMSIVGILRDRQQLSEEDLAKYDEARSETPDADDRTLLVDNKLVTEEQFLRAISVKHDIPYELPEVGSVDMRIFGKSSTRYLKHHNVVPVAVTNGKLRVILANPLDSRLILELEKMFGKPVRPTCCVAEKISEALRTLDRLQGAESDEDSVNLQYREIAEAPDGEDTGKEAVQIVDYLLARAIQLRASDLHIEPMQSQIRVRLRIDGVLQQLTDLPRDIASRLTSRIKILAGCDISERRQHQDGKIFVKVDGSEVDIRVSSYVSIFGETLVLRLLDRTKNLVKIPQIGFAPRMQTIIEDVVLKTSTGLVLVTGPTGSGKTTTLYSLIESIRDPSEKVITCEDPVEYVIEGLVQCSVNQKTGPTFSESLRSIVRQDPDTILIGEVRDKETASLAFESALTGHKVFSTFHTEDAVSVIIRMLEMGVEPFLVSSTLSSVIAQRLVRRLCKECRKPAKASAKELKFLGLERTYFSGLKLWQAQGCSSCGESGFKGRMGLHELLIPGDDFKDAVLSRQSAKELRVLARQLPEFLTMQEDGLIKAVAGETTLSELIDNAPRDIYTRAYSAIHKIADNGGQA